MLLKNYICVVLLVMQAVICSGDPIEVRSGQKLVDMLNELYSTGQADPLNTIMFVDIDNTIIRSSSDYLNGNSTKCTEVGPSNNAIPVSQEFINYLMECPFRAVGLTSATDHFLSIEPINPTGKYKTVISPIRCGTNLEHSLATIRCDAMNRLETNFWDPFGNSNSTEGPFIALPFILDNIDINYLGTSNNFDLEDGSRLLVLKSSSNDYRMFHETPEKIITEILAVPVFQGGIIFSNFIQPDRMKLIDNFLLLQGERKGDVIISFLKFLAMVQKIENLSGVCCTVIAIDDNPVMLRNIEEALSAIGIKVFDVWFNWEKKDKPLRLIPPNIQHINLHNVHLGTK